MNPHFTVHNIEKATVVEFRTSSLMDAIMLDDIGTELYRLVDAEDRRKLVLDFEKVEYLSSQAVGIIIKLHNKLSKLKNSKMMLCSVGPKLAEILKIMRLDKMLTIKPTQREAVKAFQAIG
jgi:anti-sigma B factor antagonist